MQYWNRVYYVHVHINSAYHIHIAREIALLITCHYFCTEAKRYTDAKATLNRCLELTPNDSTALFQLGTINMDMKEYEEGRTYLQAAVEASPDHEATLVNYGGL